MNNINHTQYLYKLNKTLQKFMNYTKKKKKDHEPLQDNKIQL